MSPSDQVEDEIIAALRRIMRATELHSRALMQRVGLTSSQLAALQAIARLEPVTIKQVAQAVHVSQATLTGVMSRLERQQLVQRDSGRDRRSVLLALTDRGRRLVEEHPSLLQDHFRDGLGQLADWEQSSMLAALQRVADMMERRESSPSEGKSKPERKTWLSELNAAADRGELQSWRREDFTTNPRDSGSEPLDAGAGS